ncbi:phage replication protein O [Gracilibacillus ureilyticus]|uniref:Phage replication protein O n=1 Tax=Gracilibacillus ureilyticus TaxID=531814 RepID=A0A1H9V4W7_9BACI|nr:replication protein [Gracilibacillus ureilyticus]SES16755.1 phage replication protein O [Gracilibacillus ureilyticus]
MANPELKKGYIRIANDLWNELLRRNFSKRQLNIISFIWRLSYGTGQSDCVIPTLKMFELAGLHKQDVRKELKFLTECAVLNWDEEMMVFAINKDYHKWQITPQTKWDGDQFDQLIHINIKRRVSAKEVRKTRTASNIKVRKLLTDPQKKVSKTRTFTFVKHLPKNHQNPVSAKYPASVNTYLKTLKMKDKKEYNNNAPFLEVIHFYRSNLQKGISDSPFNVELIKQWYDKFGYDLLLAAMKIAAKREAKGVKYIESVLFNWKGAGITTIEAARQYEKQFHSKKQKSQRHQTKRNIVPDWYAAHRRENIQKKPELSQEEKDKIAAESDRMLSEYLANQG